MAPRVAARRGHAPRRAVGLGEEPDRSDPDPERDWLATNALGLARAVETCQRLAEQHAPDVTRFELDGRHVALVGHLDVDQGVDLESVWATIDSGVLPGEAGLWSADEGPLPSGWHGALCRGTEDLLELPQGSVRTRDDLRGFEPGFDAGAATERAEAGHLVLRVAEDHEERVDALPGSSVSEAERGWLRGRYRRVGVSTSFSIGDTRILAMDADRDDPEGNTAVAERLAARGVLDDLGCSVVDAWADPAAPAHPPSRGRRVG